MKGVLQNKTQIEEWICDKAHTRRKRNKGLEPFNYPYDLGRKKNFSQVLNMALFINNYVYWLVGLFAVVHCGLGCFQLTQCLHCFHLAVCVVHYCDDCITLALTYSVLYVFEVVRCSLRPAGNGYKWPVKKGCNQYSFTVSEHYFCRCYILVQCVQFLMFNFWCNFNFFQFSDGANWAEERESVICSRLI